MAPARRPRPEPLHTRVPRLDAPPPPVVVREPPHVPHHEPPGYVRGERDVPLQRVRFLLASFPREYDDVVSALPSDDVIAHRETLLLFPWACSPIASLVLLVSLHGIRYRCPPLSSLAMQDAEKNSLSRSSRETSTSRSLACSSRPAITSALSSRGPTCAQATCALLPSSTHRIVAYVSNFIVSAFRWH